MQKAAKLVPFQLEAVQKDGLPIVRHERLELRQVVRVQVLQVLLGGVEIGLVLGRQLVTQRLLRDAAARFMRFLGGRGRFLSSFAAAGGGGGGSSRGRSFGLLLWLRAFLAGGRFHKQLFPDLDHVSSGWLFLLATKQESILCCAVV